MLSNITESKDIHLARRLRGERGQLLLPVTRLRGLDHVGETSTFRHDAEERLSLAGGCRPVRRYFPTELGDIFIPGLQPVCFPLFQAAVHELTTVGSKFALCLLDG